MGFNVEEIDIRVSDVSTISETSTVPGELERDMEVGSREEDIVGGRTGVE